MDSLPLLGPSKRPAYFMASFLLSTLPVGAADVLWSGATTGSLDWNTVGNWTGGVVVDSSADRADLQLDWTDTPVINLSAPVTINGILFDDTGAADDSTLTLGDGGIPANTFTLAGTAPSFAINGSTLIIGANILGAGDLNKSGAGTLVLSGANTYTGETNFGAGVINVATLSDYGVAGSLGNRASDSTTSVGLHFTGGTLQYTGSAAQSTNRQIRMLNGVKTFIDASGTGSGTVSFTSSVANVNQWDTPGTRTLTLTGSNTGNNTFALNIQSHSTGQTSLVKSGAGRWDITNSHNSDSVSGANNTFGGYGGGTVLSGGTLGFASNAIGGGVIDFTGNATLSWNTGNTQDISSGTGGGVARSLRIADGVTATFDTGVNNVTLGVAIAVGALKTGALTKDGAGVLTLTGLNTYTGATTITAGTLQIGSGGTAGALGATPIVNNSALTLHRSDALFTFANLIGGSGSVTNLGSGMLDITANNTYLGGTFINAGILRLRTDLGGGARLGSGTVTVANGASYEIWAPSAQTLANDIVLNGATGIAGRPALNQDGGGGKVTLSGAVTLNATSDIGIGGLSFNHMDITGVMSGVANAGIIVQERTTNNGFNAILTLAGANTYTGPTTLNGGTLKAGVASVANVSGAFGNNSAVTLANAANTNLDITGFNTQIGSLTGGGPSGGNVILGAATLTVGGDNTSPAEYAGAISGAGGSLVKTGSGTLTLSGANTYTGATTVNGGTLKNGAATAFNSTGALAMAGTGIFDLNGFNAGFTNVSGAVNTATITDSAAGAGTSTLAIGAQASTVSALILDGASRKVAVTLKNDNGGTVPFLLTGANTFSGGLTLLHTAVGTRLRITGLVTTAGSPGAITSSPFGTGAITIGLAATDKAGILLDTVANNTIVNDIVFNTILGTDQPGIRLDTTGHTFSGTITANLSDALFANTGSASLTGKVTGANGLQLAGAGTALAITLGGSAANDYAGLTQVKAGMLILAKPVGVNAIPGNITIGDGLNNDIVRVTANEQIADSALISFNSGGNLNSAFLQLAGGVTETVSGISTTLPGMAPVIESSSAGTGTLIVNTAADSLYDGILRNANGGTLAFTKEGAGNLTFQNTGGVVATNYSGATLISGGTLTLSSAAASGNTGAKAVINSFASPITNNAALVLSNEDSSETFSRVISGSGSLTKSGLGTVTLNQRNTYSGGTTVDSGTLNIAIVEGIPGGYSGLGTATSANVVTVNNGAILTGTANNWLDNTSALSGGSNAHTLVVNAGGKVTSGGGVITGLGNITLNGGTLELNTGYGASSPWNGAYTLMGDITVGGVSPSAITTKVGAGASANLQMSNGSNGVGGTRTLTVADVTGSPDSDLVVSGQIINGTLVKDGPGTVELALGTVGSTAAVNWRLNEGALKTTSNNVVGGSANITGTSTGTTFDLGGTTQAVGSLGAIGTGNGYRGSILNGTINLNGQNAYLQNGTFTMDLAGGGGSRLWIGGDASATVYLGGFNTSTFTDTNSTIIGHPTTGAAGMVVLQSATALGPASQNAQVFSGTLDFNGQTGITNGSILLASGASSNLVNANTSTEATYAGGINLNNSDSSAIGGAGDLTLGGVVSNGGFTKTGAGTLTLGGGNTYAGITDVQEGTLLINGTTLSTGLIAVTGAATLGGSTGAGQIGEVVMNVGTFLRPGDTARSDNWMNVQNLTLADTTQLHFELAGKSETTTSDNDFIGIAFDLTLKGVLNVIPQAGFGTPMAGDKWLLMTYGGNLTENTLTVATAAPSGLSYVIDTGSTPGSVFLTAVPESGTAGLLILGLLLLRRLRRR